MDALRRDTFNHFPAAPPPLDLVEEYALDGGVGSRFAFTSEDGWRLHGSAATLTDVTAGRLRPSSCSARRAKGATI